MSGKGSFAMNRLVGFRSAGVCVLAVYVVTSFVYSDFGVSAAIGASFLCLYALICLLLFFFSGDWRYKNWDVVDFAYLLFVGVVAFNFLRVFELDRTTLYYCLTLGAAAVIFWTSAPVGRGFARFAKGVILAGGFFSAVLALAQVIAPTAFAEVVYPFLSETSKAYNERLFALGYGFALSEDIGYSATLMVFSAGILVSVMNEGNFRKLSLVLFVIFAGLFSLQRRGEFLACIAALVVVTFVRLAYDRAGANSADSRWRKAMLLFGSQIVPLALAFLFVSCFAGEGRLAGTVSEVIDASGGDVRSVVDSVGNGRLSLWGLAWQGFLENPVLGSGWGSFADIAPASGNTHAINAHNIYLQLLCETGLLGFLAMGAVFLVLLLSVMNKLGSRLGDARSASLYFALFVLLFILVKGLVDNSLFHHYAVLTMVLSSLLAFRSAKCGLDSESPRDPSAEKD